MGVAVGFEFQTGGCHYARNDDTAKKIKQIRAHGGRCHDEKTGGETAPAECVEANFPKYWIYCTEENFDLIFLF